MRIEIDLPEEMMAQLDEMARVRGADRADASIIRRSTKGSSYEFRDARYAMAIRVLLRKDEGREKVFKLD
jgi:hypothetical protein